MNYYSPRVHINHPRVNQPQTWHQEAEEALRARLREAEDKVKKLLSKIEYSYACPNCGSIHLQVSVTARAALTQDEEDGNLQTWVFGNHEWDNDSPMECSDCQYSGSARRFIVPHRLRLYERLAQNT